ncbi:MAG: UvrD-helicase domain-containing protein [Ilumatobacter sp.]|uniref:UvrD-helicase domain-containing protein n=1 Tax=Ilumatobacter sp. TaxID=1967498 RepID=UPI00391AFEB3
MMSEAPDRLAERPPPPDEADRSRIRNDLDATLFVEAGAGAGKTTALVQRVVNLVRSGIPITSIAAITFTEKAAAELRSRLRSELSLLDLPAARTAASELDHAPIGTLHAFARRILNDVPIQAGLPPGFGVLAELESNVRFADEWSDLLDRLLADAEPDGGVVEGGRLLVDLCEFDGFGVQTGLRKVATDFRANWDLVVDRVDDTPPPPFRLAAKPIADLAADIAATPVPEGDQQAVLLARLRTAATRLAATDDLYSQLRLIAEIAPIIGKAKRGSKAKWKGLGVAALDELREREADLAARAAAELRRTCEYRRNAIGVICRRFVLDAVRRRVEAGVLDFHDLLVHARRVLSTRPEVRTELHQRYQRVLLDEFQDTDPIQLEIAVRLTAAPDDPAHDHDWRTLRPVPGRLFIVGDPKQSIYRFRRADISQYLAAADQLGADIARLSANFRSTDAVIDATNALFEQVILDDPGAQPPFQHLDAARADAHRHHGSVHVLGAEHHADLAAAPQGGTVSKADELRRREALDVVGTVITALDDGWLVVDDDTKQLRPCRPGDICILLPTRSSLAALDREFRATTVPYRAENTSSVYASSEVRALLLALRAADDPTDELALVATLRSTLYGCSDPDLLTWKRAGGTWGLWQAPPEGFDDHIVAVSIRHLRDVAERCSTTSAADLLSAIADECRVFDLALVDADHRDVWRRVRFVIDQARAWADAGGRGIRRYLSWTQLQASTGTVSESILPEHDHDAVRLMTVHASKGLEFPITIVSGLTGRPRGRSSTDVIWDGDSWHFVGSKDDGLDEVRERDATMSEAERRRLLYVACTRAVDHLVISLHRARPDDKIHALEVDTLTSAELLWRCGAAEIGTPFELPSGRSVNAADVTRSHPATPQIDLAEWRRELEHIHDVASRRGAVAATRLADEVRLRRDRDPAASAARLDRQPEISIPPWQRGRYGTSIGRAVHGTLQFCDLVTGDDVDDIARAQCAVEGIVGFDRRVGELVRSALAAPIVRSMAAGAEHWRELFIAAPIGARVLEGYIDALVRTPDGLLIVDYKTDSWSGPVQTRERVGRYRTQLAAYGAALEATLGEQVAGGVLVRCIAGEPAEEVWIEHWREAVDEVTSLVS